MEQEKDMVGVEGTLGSYESGRDLSISESIHRGNVTQKNAAARLRKFPFMLKFQLQEPQFPLAANCQRVRAREYLGTATGWGISASFGSRYKTPIISHRLALSTKSS